MSINSTYCITLKLQALILWAFSQLLFRIEISERLNRIVILRAMKSNYWTPWRLLFYLNYCLWHLDLNHYFNLYICLSFYPAFLCQTSEFHHVQCQVPHLIASTARMSLPTSKAVIPRIGSLRVNLNNSYYCLCIRDF